MGSLRRCLPPFSYLVGGSVKGVSPTILRQAQTIPCLLSPVVSILSFVEMAAWRHARCGTSHVLFLNFELRPRLCGGS